MNCQEVKQHLLDYEYGELRPELAREVEAALEGCAECQQELERLRQVRSVLREALPEEDVPHLVHANIMREARRQAERMQVEEASSVWETLKSWLTHPTVGVAAAAAVVIVISLVFADTQNPPANEAMAPTSVARGDLPAPPVMAEPAATGAASPAVEAAPVPELAMNADLPAGGQEGEAPVIVAQRERGEGGLGDGRLANANAPIELAMADKAATKGAALPAAAAADEKLAEEAQADDAQGPPAEPVVAQAQPADRSDAPTSPPVKADGGKSTGEVWQVADARPKDDAAEDADKSIVHQSVTNAVVARRNTRSSAGESAYDGNADSFAGLGGDKSNGSLLGGGGGAGGAKSGGNAYGGEKLELDEGNAEVQANKDARVDNAPFDLKKAEEAVNRGRQEENRGNAPGAVVAYDEALRNAPSGSVYHEEALYHRALNQARSGNHGAAVVSFRQVLQQYPQGQNAEWAKYYLARSLLAQNPTDTEAERLLDELASGGGGGVAQQAQRDYDQAFGRRDKAKKAPARSMEPKPANQRKGKAKKYDSYDYESPSPNSVETE